MEAAGIHSVEFIFLLLLLFVAGLAALAKRFATPYPIVLVIGGLILSFFPRAPHVALNPDIVFLVILPPLLFSSAFVTSWREFRYNFVSISMLALGLVLFTVRGVAHISQWILPGFDFRLGLVLGAVVCTTDAIAATTIAKRVGLPKRITDVVEAESLVNDASGLLALDLAVALVITGHASSPVVQAERLLYLIASSIVIGLIVAKLIYYFETKIDDAPIEITLSLIAPYVAYLSAESAHSSGVLATVVCGLYLGHKSSLYLSIGARLKGYAVWDTLTFILNGFVFILIGLQLPYVLEGIREYTLVHLLVLGGLFSVAVILLRLVWVYPGAWVSNFIRRRLLHQPEPLPNPRSIFIVGWTGMRGVVALAAAISLPEYLNDGSPFPQRNLIIFLTFSVIFVTLVLQGLTLPPLIRWLGLAGADVKNPEEEQARRNMIEAALAYLEAARENDSSEFEPVYDELIHSQRHRLSRLEGTDAGDSEHDPRHYERYLEMAHKLRALQRATILNLRNQNQIGDETLRKLEYELDLLDAQSSTSGTPAR
ncbi:MAG: Na+/H+ antiporter [Candidatus Acidiferrales bacterium]